MHPCFAAVVDVHSRGVSCVKFSAYSRDQANSSHDKKIVMNAAFGSTDDDVRLVFSQSDGSSTAELYHSAGQSWVLAHDSEQGADVSLIDSRNGSAADIRAWIKQSLDVPPTLWATDLRTGASKLLWDPNPEISNKGLGRASVYHWVDKTGYTWTGGLVMPVGYVKGRKYPLVIQTYAFSPDAFLADGMDTTAEAAMPLASVGVVVLQVAKRIDHTDTNEEATIQLPVMRLLLES